MNNEQIQLDDLVSYINNEVQNNNGPKPKKGCNKNPQN